MASTSARTSVESNPINADQIATFFMKLSTAQLPLLSKFREPIPERSIRKRTRGQYSPGGVFPVDERKVEEAQRENERGKLVGVLEELNQEIGTQYETHSPSTDKKFGHVCIVEIKYNGVTVAFNRGVHKTDPKLALSDALLTTVKFLLANRKSV